MNISVIIPALNEAKDIAGAIASAGCGAEIIVADGGSSDGTAAVARALGARVLVTGRGRGAQMDEAALKATGDVLVFLHADTRLPFGYLDGIEGALRDKRAAGGAFRLSIDSKGLGFRMIECLAAFRSSVFNIAYGDQIIFARKEAFLRAGGFGKLPLMEDVDCVKRLKGQGRFILVNGRALTSARRWLSRGILKNTLKNSLTLSLYLAGVSPQRLYKWYYNG